MTLWKHQEDAVQSALAMMPGGFGFFMEQRTGKSRAAIEVARRLEARRVREPGVAGSPLPWRVLVLCPSVQGNVPKVWMAEARAQWPGMRIVNLTGTVRERAQQLAGLDEYPAIVICNYESAARAPLGPAFGKRGAIKSVGALASMRWDVLICDEGHRIKNPVGQWQRMAALIARRTPARLLLTGTPMHSPLDIWGELNIIDPYICSVTVREGNVVDCEHEWKDL